MSKITIYKIYIANGHRSKTKYYETTKSFEYWHKEHKKFYRAVTAYKLVRGKWKII